jgi:type IV secretion system protein TrbL
MRRGRVGVLWVGVVLFALFGAAIVAHAQGQPIPNGNLLNTVQAGFQGAVVNWGVAIQTVATRLFWTLVLISMVWTFGMMALRKAEFQEVIAELLRFMVVTGFFLWLLTNGPAMATSILRSLMTVGQTAGGLPANVTPSSILSMGFNVMGLAARSASFWNHPIDSLVILLAGFIDLVIFALIAVNMLLLTITGWMVAYAGVFFLGFGGSRWTSDLAIQYFKTALNIGIQLMTMVLIVGVGNTFLAGQIAALPANLGIMDMAVLLVSALVLLELVNKVPSLVGSMAGGSTGGIGQHGAAAAIGTMATGVAAAAMMGSVAMAGARGALGGASAVMAAYKAAGEGGGGGSGGGGSSGGAGASLVGGTGASASGAGSLSAAMGGAIGGEAGGGSLAPDSGGGSSGSGGGSGGGGGGADNRAAGQNADEVAASSTADEAAGASDADGAAASTHAGAAAEVPSGASTQGDADTEDGAAPSGFANQSRLAAAAARLARTSALLALGAKDVGIAGAKNSISQTTGGKIATAIKSRAASKQLSPDAVAEIKAFADKKPPDETIPPVS